MHALAGGGDVLAGGRAAGAMLLAHERRTVPLLAAAVPVHLALSLGWAAVLAPLLPRGAEVPAGIAGGLAIAALDLRVIAPRRFPAVWRAAPAAAVGRPRRVRRCGRGRLGVAPRPAFVARPQKRTAARR